MPSTKGLTWLENLNEGKKDKEEQKEGKEKREARHHENFLGYKGQECLPWNFLPTSTTKLNILKPIFSPIAAPESVCFYENHVPNIMSHFKITHVKFIKCSSSVVIRVILWFHIWRASMMEFRNVQMCIDQFISSYICRKQRLKFKWIHSGCPCLPSSDENSDE